MILAISGSGRKDRMIHQAVSLIGEKCEEDFEVISLAGKRINGCIGCVQCASDNICKLKDDWNDLGIKMKNADVIIFGAPNYYGTINDLSHACLERTFCFRHREVFSLENKLGFIVTTSRDEHIENPVFKIIEKFMLSNKMKILGSISVEGYDQCYTCGYGHNCKVGNVVNKYGVLEEILPKHLPKEIWEQNATIEKINNAALQIKRRGV